MATWVTSQRQAFKTGALDAARAARLESVPGWAWRIADAAWDEAYARLERYVEREGHARVPQAFMDDGFPLGAWVGHQRQLYRKRGGLIPVRRKRLESLPGWLWDPLTAKWEASFSRLLSYVTRVGDAHVPDDYSEDGDKLGQWVTLQRRAFRKGALDPSRARRLEALPGWVWSVSDADWENAYARLKRYVEREGHSRVVHSYQDGDGYRLGQWVSNRRGGIGAVRSRRTARSVSSPAGLGLGGT